MAAHAGGGFDLRLHPIEFLNVLGILESSVLLFRVFRTWVSVVGPLRSDHLARGVVLKVSSLFRGPADELPGANLPVGAVSGSFVSDGIHADQFRWNEDVDINRCFLLIASRCRLPDSFRQHVATEFCKPASFRITVRKENGVSDTLGRDNARADELVGTANTR
ncbi:hypothetical protein FRD01_22770 [Microvenator marinus]|uniref:Uncharacterized protein n=1 Tax=Microvenator marinus TaxID=2600177 RepID=A0A5B8XX27_9DELT|nr:hypothetical protein [Microvenator marinus]QED30004.1 hypothetical protein FRD01_22770 [Microvenator marinus]